MKKIFLLSLLAIVFFSCKKDDTTDDQPGQEPVQVEKKLRKYIVDGNVKYENFYTGTKLHQSIRYLESGEISGQELRHYPSNNEMRQEFYWNASGNYVLTQYYNYTYTNGLVTSRESFDVQGTNEYYEGYASYSNEEGDDSNLTQAIYYNENGIMTTWFTITYLDANGSSEAKHYNSENEYTKSEYWTRDNKKASDFYIDPFPYQHVHNTVAKEIIFADATTADYSYTSVFEYDNDNYPIKQTKTYHDGDVEIITFEYYPVD